MPSSPIILNSPVLLFLGAGASAPLDKAMMAQFVKKLSSQIDDDHQKELLRELIEFRSADLEAIMGELDTIISLNYANTVSGYRKVGGSTTQFSLNRATAWQLQHNIKHAVIKEYRNVDAAKAVEVYQPILDKIFSRLDEENHCLTLFTTNYDPAIEVFCESKYNEYSLCDGFRYSPADRHNYWHRSVFDDYRLESGKRNLTLFKLHGSVDWLYVKATDRIRRGQAMFTSVDSDAYSNVLIYPAMRKIATDDPYYSAYEYYQRCCETAKLCIVIGYSFRDYDALTRLRGAVSVNDNLQLALLAPDAAGLLESIPIPEGRKKALPYNFGDVRQQSEYLTALDEYLGHL